MVVASWTAGNLLPKCLSRMTSIYMGATCSVVFLLGMAALEWSFTPAFIIPMAMVLEVLGGLGQGTNETCLMAILSSYKERREEYLGYYEIIFAIGTCFGPILGALLYTLGGYQTPFFVFASTYAFIVILFYCTVPDQLDPEQEGSEEYMAKAVAADAMKSEEEKRREQLPETDLTLC